MKYIVWILLTICCVSANAQFTGTDSLRNYNNKYITNNAATAFTNLRLNTLLRGMIDWIDTARAGTGGGGALGIDTLWALNDSTVRYRKNGVFRNMIVKGVYDSRRKVDTLFKQNDSTLAYTINGIQRTIIIPGAVDNSITTGSRTVLADFVQNWNNHLFFINNVNYLEFNSQRPDPGIIAGNVFKQSFYLDSTINGRPYSLNWSLRNAADDGDSIRGVLETNESTTSILNAGDNDNHFGFWQFIGDNNPKLTGSLSGGFKSSTYEFGHKAIINPNDSVRIKLESAAATAKIMGVRAESSGLWTPVAIDAPSSQNIANASLTANADYIQDWNDKWFFMHDLKALELTSNRTDPVYTGNKKTFRFYSDSTADATALQLAWGLKDVSNSSTDSVHGELSSNLVSTSITHWGHVGARYAQVDIRGNIIDPTIEMTAANETKASSLILGSTTYINPNDSLKLKAIPATTAPKLLGFRDITGNVGTVVAIDAPTSITLSNVGTGYRWVKTGSGQIKSVENTNTINWDSTSNTLKANADTSYIATLSDLKDTAAAIRAASGGTPAGSTGNVQYNNAGSFGAEAAYTYNSTTDALTVGNTITDSTRYRKVINTAMVVDSFVANGNSITAGVNASTVDSNYVSQTGHHYGIPFTNKGVSGHVAFQACAINLSYINPGHHAAVSLEIGLNDLVNNGGSTNVYRGIRNAYEAAMVNTFLASYAAASSCTLTGSWTTGINAVSTAGGKTTTAASTSTNEDSLSKDITATGIGIGLIGAAGNAGSAVVYIDGVKVDSFNTGQQTPAVGASYQPMGKYYTGLSNTSHHVKVVKRGGSGALFIDYVGALLAPASQRPFIMIDIPFLDSTGYALGSATSAATIIANDSLNNAFNRARRAGLKVYHAKTNNYYQARTDAGLSSDHVHPKDPGYRQIFNSIVAAIDAVYGQVGVIQFTDANRFYANDSSGEGHQIAYIDDLTARPITLNGINNTGSDSTSGNLIVDSNFTLYGNFIRSATFNRGVTIRGDGTNGATKWIVWRVGETAGSMSRFGVGAYNDGVKNHTNIFTDGYSGDVVSLGQVDVADGSTYTPYFEVSNNSSKALGPFIANGTSTLTGATTANGVTINGDNVFSREWNLYAPGLGIKHGMRTSGASPYYTDVYTSWNGSTTAVRLGWMDTDGTTFHPIFSTKVNGLANIASLTGQNDTTTYKPLVVNSSGDIYKMVGWPSAGTSGITDINGETGPSYTIQGGAGIQVTPTTNTATIEIVQQSSALPHPLMDFYSPANNSGTSESDLFSFTTTSNTLAVDGQKLVFKASGTFNDITTTNQIRVYWGATELFNSGGLTISATGSWSFETTIIRASSSTGIATTTFQNTYGSSTTLVNVIDLSSQNFATTNVIKVTGTASGAGGGSNDITAKMGYIMFLPIPI